MADIRNFFSNGASQIEIPPGEYAGPLIIRHSCIVDGHGATLWTKTGAALVIDAPSVTVKNLRVELMTKTDEFVAIEVLDKNVQLENIEVYGNIRGFDNASENWELPRTIDFGTFAANERNEFLSSFKIGEPCRVINSVYGLDIAPQTFSPGEIDLQLTINPMRDSMILYGSFLLETTNKILRRIYVSGRAQSGASIKTVIKPQSIPPTPQTLTPPSSQQKKFYPVSTKVRKKQQIFTLNAESVRVAFKATHLPNGMTIDAYAFCLAKNKKVQRDADLIFFNNPRHESLGVSLDSKGNMPGIDLNLKNLPEDIKSIVICFGIYDDGTRSDNNFSKVSSPEVVVFANENLAYKFPVQLGQEKIFKALEIYRDKDDWEFRFVGLGSEKNFTNFCESYGVEVF